MAGPWEKYQSTTTAVEDGPWAKYGGAEPKRSAASSIEPPKMNVGAPASQPMTQHYLIGGGGNDPVRPVAESVGDVAGGMVKNVGYLAAMTPTLVHRGLQKQGVVGEGDVFPGEHSYKEVQEQDVPNAAMTVMTGAAEGMEAEPRPVTPRGRTVAEVPKGGERLAPEQVEAVEKANRGYQAAKSQVERRQGLEQASRSMTQKTFDNLHQTHDAARGALDQRWGQFREGMAGAQLDPAEAYNNIEAAKAKYLKGSPASLTVFNNLAKELGIQEFMDEPNGTLKAIPGTGELPFDTARVHYSAVGDKLAQGNLPGNVYQALKAVEQGLDKQLTKAAETRNLGKDYTALKAEEHQFRTDWTDAKSPLAKAYKALDANYLEPIVRGRGNDYITRQLERYRKYGAQPHLPLAARRYAEEASTITKKVPEVKELPKPKTPVPAKGTLGRKAARIGGKLVGGTVGGAVGHPFLGYATGGEVGAELYDRIKRPKTVPEPPDE